MLYFFKTWWSKDVKYDILKCQYHSTRPQLIQLIPTVQITLFTSSFQGKFLKIRVTKVTCTCSFFMYMYIFPSFTTPRGIFGQKWPTSNTQKMTKNGKKRTSGNCGNTHSSTFHIERPFSRYGRSKLKFLCKRISHCIYNFCSLELTKTRNTWSLTAVQGVWQAIMTHIFHRRHRQCNVSVIY